MNETALFAAVGAAVVIVAATAFFYLGRKLGVAKELRRQAQAQATAEETAKRITADAGREADTIRKSALLSGKEELMRAREDWEAEAKKRREEVVREEKRVDDKETQLNRKYDLLEQREKDAQRIAVDVEKRAEKLGARENELEKMVAEERHRLEQLAGLSAQDAKN
ncbi:MAG: DUF3552 domain-containing protein, partial [Gemmatimonadaceae bacterium]|nr:DUF3552 domain-containing protein [Gemmatimonadaceae bacterium]